MKIVIIFYPIVALWLATACSESNPAPEPKNNPEEDSIRLEISDKNATEETKALYSWLWKIQETGFMFGHHDDLIYGREWIQEPGRSDVKEVCGDYPAVFSVDFAEIMDDRHDTDPLNDARKTAIMEARQRGEVILACSHLNNPYTGGDAWDNSDNTVVARILEDGSNTQLKFNGWLDNLADFLLELKDRNGKLIPVIYRPFHEHTQNWSWWGTSCTTKTEFINLWHYTIDYLKNTKGVHNLIYAIAPQLDSPGNKDQLLFRWPGNDYVDFIGMDSYNGTNTLALQTNSINLELISKDLKKPCGITETGIEGILNSNGQEYSTYWTKEILTPLIGRNISMVVMWRNKYDPNHTGHHFFGPYIGHSSSDDFQEFYESPITLFSADLPDMYKLADEVTVE